MQNDELSDEDELGENTFSSSDFDALLEEDDELPIEDLEVDALEKDPLIEDESASEEEDNEDDIDDGFSEFNDYEE